MSVSAASTPLEPPAPRKSGAGRIILWIVLALVLIPIVLMVSCEVLILGNRARVDGANRARGEQIVAALEKFRSDQKKYPETLRSLEPRYISQLPLMKRYEEDPGREFTYQRSNDGSGFTLEYMGAPVSVGPCDCGFKYDSASRTWQPVLY